MAEEKTFWEIVEHRTASEIPPPPDPIIVPRSYFDARIKADNTLAPSEKLKTESRYIRIAGAAIAGALLVQLSIVPWSWDVSNRFDLWVGSFMLLGWAVYEGLLFRVERRHRLAMELSGSADQALLAMASIGTEMYLRRGEDLHRVLVRADGVLISREPSEAPENLQDWESEFDNSLNQ